MKQSLHKIAGAAKRVSSFALALTFVVALAASVTQQVSAATTSMTAAPRVTFTFDDGLQSATLAQQTLAQNGITNATAYIITNCIGKTATDHCVAADDNATYMTWAQVQALKAAGWNIGSHTETHPLLTTVTAAELKEQLAGSKAALAAQGIDAVDLAVPYGDYNNTVLAEAAKYYATLRGFADIGPNVWPYDDRLVLNEQVQEGTTVSSDAAASTYATVKAKIDSAITNNQWLTLTFHDIVATMPTNTNQYATTTTLLGQIAAYVKQQADAGKISVVSPHDAIVNNTPNMLGDGSFDGALSTDRTQTSVWSTDDTTGTLVKKDAATNGSYVLGNATSATNSVYMTANAADTHLFAPKVTVDPTQTYVVKGYVHVTAMTAGEVGFYVDEYDAAGTYLSTVYHSGIRYSADANAILVKNVNFAYKPSTTAVASAQVYVNVQANSGIQAYVDNIEMFSPTTVVTPPADTTAPVISGTTATPGSTAATIGWTTDEAADSTVRFGTDTTYTGTPVANAAMSTAHSIALSGLTASTTYRYQVVSKDAAGNTSTSADMTFTTTAAGTAIVGDITGDGIVNNDDATILFANWGTTPQAGDINNNGVVDNDDATLLFANWSK